MSFFASAQGTLQYFFPCSGTQLQPGWAHFDFAVIEVPFLERAFDLERNSCAENLLLALSDSSVLCWVHLRSITGLHERPGQSIPFCSLLQISESQVEVSSVGKALLTQQNIP